MQCCLQHDPEVCTPGGEDGNFIMFARATSGDKKNNNQFSPCSLNSISPVLNAKARSPKGCFTGELLYSVYQLWVSLSNGEKCAVFSEFKNISVKSVVIRKSLKNLPMIMSENWVFSPVWSTVMCNSDIVRVCNLFQSKLVSKNQYFKNQIFLLLNNK